MKKALHQIVGYIIGGLLVLLIIPYVIYSLAKRFDPICGLKLFQAGQLRIALVMILFLIGFVFGFGLLLSNILLEKGGLYMLAALK